MFAFATYLFSAIVLNYQQAHYLLIFNNYKIDL